MLLLIVACDGQGDSDTGPCSEGDATVEVGQTAVLSDGTQQWVAAEEGVPATLIHGPQGGWHLLASARVSNMDPIVTLDYDITVGDGGAEVSNNTYRVQLIEAAVCVGDYPGMYGYLDVSGIEEGALDTPPELLGGVLLTLTMTATDYSGRVATDTLHVVGELDEVDE